MEFVNTDNFKIKDGVIIKLFNPNITTEILNREYKNKLIGIDDYCFKDNKAITNIQLPKTIQELGRYSFAKCSNLVKVELPRKLSKLGYGTFSECHNLNTIKLPNSIELIPNRSFEKCSSLNSIELPNKLVYIGHSAFMGCASLKSIVIPGSVIKIEDDAFKYCDCEITYKQQTAQLRTANGQVYVLLNSKTFNGLTVYIAQPFTDWINQKDNLVYIASYQNGLIYTVSENRKDVVKVLRSEINKQSHTLNIVERIKKNKAGSCRDFRALLLGQDLGCYDGMQDFIDEFTGLDLEICDGNKGPGKDIDVEIPVVDIILPLKYHREYTHFVNLMGKDFIAELINGANAK